MAVSNNPAGSITPAGNTMSYPRGQSGARTRNVININNPGSEGTATFTLTTATATTDGIPDVLKESEAGDDRKTEGLSNFRRQRYLHVLATNNNTADTVKFKIWLYNSAFEQWGCLNQLISKGDGAALEQKQVEITVADDAQEYFIFDIKGAERIFIQCTDAAGANDCTVFLGVNSF